MHYYGQCHGRTQSQIDEARTKKHIEDKCVGDQKFTICDKSKHDHCTGKDYAEAIYAFESETQEEGKFTVVIVCHRCLKLSNLNFVIELIDKYP